MKRLLLLCLIIPFVSHAQLKHWRMNETMRYYADYDFDRNKMTSQPIEAYVNVIIQIDDDGTGVLITYIGNNKTVFSITSATSFDSENITHIMCSNYKNQPVPAGVKMERRGDGYVVSQVWITNSNTRTALLFYD